MYIIFLEMTFEKIKKFKRNYYTSTIFRIIDLLLYELKFSISSRNLLRAI